MSASAACQVKTLSELLGLEGPVARACPAVDGYNGAALWLSPLGDVADRNAAAEAWIGLEGLDTSIAGLANEVRASGLPRAAQCDLATSPDAPLRRFGLTALPHEGGVLILGQETSAEARHLQVLKASREMFRDVALCADGILFETDAAGVIRWTGQAKILGYRDEELLGRPARELLSGVMAADPFMAREPLVDAPYWFESAHEGPRAMALTLRPIVSKSGLWCGVRGLARDVTDELRTRRRESLTRTMLDVVRGREAPEAMLTALASSMADGCGVEGAWLFPRDPQLDCASASGVGPCDMMREIASRVMSEAADTPVVFSSGDWSGLAIALRAQGEPVGAALIGRPTADGMLDHEALEILRQSAPMLSIALVHIQTQSALRIQRSVDPLTGLLNKRGFSDEGARRLKSLQEQGRAPALFLISCGHFKAIGDCLGPAASEEMLLEIARALRGLVKDDGLCARLETSEFALFYDHVEPGESDARASEILQAFRTASRRMSLALAVTPSIGLAMTDPNRRVGMDQWIAQAAQSLSAAKRPVRGRTGAK